MNSDEKSFLKSEDRQFLPSLEHKFIQYLVEEEAEWKKLQARRAEKLTRMKHEAAEKGDVVPSFLTAEDEEEFLGEIEEKNMLKNDRSKKPWQFLRLCVLTPQVEPIWMTAAEGDAGGEDSSADALQPVPGIDLFMRSEGSLQKLLDSFEQERLRKLSKAGGAVADAMEDVAELSELVKVEEVVKMEADEPMASPIEASPMTTPAASPIGSEDAAPTPASSPVAATDESATETPAEADDGQEEPPKKRVKVETPTADE
jgi:hypothetical protein